MHAQTSRLAVTMRELHVQMPAAVSSSRHVPPEATAGIHVRTLTAERLQPDDEGYDEGYAGMLITLHDATVEVADKSAGYAVPVRVGGGADSAAPGPAEAMAPAPSGTPWGACPVMTPVAAPAATPGLCRTSNAPAPGFTSPIPTATAAAAAAAAGGGGGGGPFGSAGGAFSGSGFGSGLGSGFGSSDASPANTAGAMFTSAVMSFPRLRVKLEYPALPGGGIPLGIPEQTTTVMPPPHVSIRCTPWQLSVLSSIYTYNFGMYTNYVNPLCELPDDHTLLRLRILHPSLSLTLVLPEQLRPALELSLHRFSIEMRWRQDFSAVCKLKAQGIAVHGFDEHASLPLLSAAIRVPPPPSEPAESVHDSVLSDAYESADEGSASASFAQSTSFDLKAQRLEALSALEAHLAERHGKELDGLLSSNASVGGASACSGASACGGASSSCGVGGGGVGGMLNAALSVITPDTTGFDPEELAADREASRSRQQQAGRSKSRFRANRRSLGGTSGGSSSAGAPPPPSPMDGPPATAEATPPRGAEARLRRFQSGGSGVSPGAPVTPSMPLPDGLALDATTPLSQEQLLARTNAPGHARSASGGSGGSREDESSGHRKRVTPSRRSYMGYGPPGGGGGGPPPPP
jgi:hypothetical protein